MARDPRRLTRAGVRALVDLQAETADQRESLRPIAIAYLKLPVRDFAAPSLEELDRVTDWILDRMAEDLPVLIHCRAGAGRSAAFAIATLMRIGYPLAVAYNQLRQQLPEIALSEAQLSVLRAFGKRVDH